MRGESLVAFLHDTNVRRFAFKTKYFKDKNTDLASDFDVFSALCDSVLLFAEHPIKSEFLSVLEDLSSSAIEPVNLLCAEYRRAVWQKIFYDDAVDACVRASCFDNIAFSQQFIFGKSINIEELVCKNCVSSFDALESALLEISEQKADILTFDIRYINYERPDDYHAERAYLDVKQGKSGDVFWLWLLCRILMKTKLKLRLIVNSAKDVEQILELLSTVKLSPEIYICVDILEQNEYQGYIDLILNNYKKNISLEPLFSKEIDSNILFENLKKLFCTVPLACVRVTLESADILCESFDNIFADSLSKSERSILISSLKTVK